MATYEFLSFDADTEIVFQAAQRTMEDLRLTVEYAEIDRNLIHFRSSSKWRWLGGQKMSMSFLEEMGNVIDLRVSPRLNDHGEILEVPDWSDGRTLAKIILARISEYIDADSPTVLLEPETKPSHCPICHAIANDGTYCVVCAKSRVPTDIPTGLAPIKRREESEDEFFDSLGIEGLGKKGKSKPKPKPKAKPAAPAETQELMVICDCGAKLRIKSHAKGAKLRCPKCQLAIVLD